MKKNKGFTLIELLAVILIISVIMLIAVPAINGLIAKAKIEALKDSTSNIVDAAKLYHANLEGDIGNKVFTLENGVFSSGSEKLDYKGMIKGTGSLVINSDGDVTVCVNSENNYVYKNYDSNSYELGSGGSCSIKQDLFSNNYLAYETDGGTQVTDYYTKDEVNALLTNLAANNVKYDNTSSGLTSTNVNTALDEVATLAKNGKIEDVFSEAKTSTASTNDATVTYKTYTVPKDGVLISSFSIMSMASPTIITVEAQIWKNSVAYAWDGAKTNTATTYKMSSASAVIPVVAGDVITYKYYAHTAGTFNIAIGHVLFAN